jgi:hypothetical protein
VPTPNRQEGLLVAATYRKSAAPDVFAGAYEQMHAMEEHLRSNAAFASDHAELERYVNEQGREIERRMLQAHLDLRAARERRVDVRGADGVRRTERRESLRVLVTIVGEVEVRRWAYRAKGVETLHPADAALNLPMDRYSFGVRRLVAEEACRGSFEEVLEQTKKTIGVAVPKRQTEELTMRAAQDFVTFYAMRAVEVEATTAPLIFSREPERGRLQRESRGENCQQAWELNRTELALGRLAEGVFRRCRAWRAAPANLTARIEADATSNGGHGGFLRERAAA